MQTISLASGLRPTPSAVAEAEFHDTRRASPDSRTAAASGVAFDRAAIAAPHPYHDNGLRKTKYNHNYPEEIHRTPTPPQSEMPLLRAMPRRPRTPAPAPISPEQ